MMDDKSREVVSQGKYRLLMCYPGQVQTAVCKPLFDEMQAELGATMGLDVRDPALKVWIIENLGIMLPVDAGGWYLCDQEKSEPADLRDDGEINLGEKPQPKYPASEEVDTKRSWRDF